MEQGETLPACLSREIYEELAVHISTPRPFFMVDHKYPTFDIRLCALKASIVGGQLHPRDHEEFTWIMPSLLSTMDLAPADVGLAQFIVM